MSLQSTYLKKLLTDAGYDLHREEDGWIIGCSSYYYQHEAAVLNSEVTVLALPEMVAMQLNTHEHGGFVPLSDAPEAFLMGMALDVGELLFWLKKSVRLSPEEPKGVTETDVHGLVKQRRGQDKLRDDLMTYWNSKCAVTNVDTEEFLIASHIKPWSECESSTEKLDPYNALLLNVALDKAFDRGYITFDDDGKIKLNPSWNWEEANLMGIKSNMKLHQIDQRHKHYLQYHRKNIWKT